VLVVDDEPDARELVSAVLSDAAAEVLAARCRRCAHTRPSQASRCDRQRHRHARARRLSVHPRCATTPSSVANTIALTAFARSEDRAAMLAGYQIHIAKPVEPHELWPPSRAWLDERGILTSGERDSRIQPRFAGAPRSRPARIRGVARKHSSGGCIASERLW
jgi:CheY-like chemotaxis protein